MLATGNSAVAAVSKLKEDGAQQIKFVCLLAAPEGIQHFRDSHPDVPVFTAAIDLRLNDHGYIVPGPGRRRRSPLRHEVRRNRSYRVAKRRASQTSGRGSPQAMCRNSGWRWLIRTLRSSPRAGTDGTISTAVRPLSYQASP